MSNQATVPVSERAIIARINRKLRPDLIQLKKLRGDRWLSDLGRYYLIDGSNHVAGTDIDLAEYATELGVLKPWERLAED